MKAKIVKGDTVIAITGKDAGKTGKVLKVIAKSRTNEHWCVVEGLNMQHHFVKANPQANEQGGIKHKEAPINISNLALVDSNGKPSKAGIKQLEDGTKVRFLKTTGETVAVQQ